MCHAHRKKWNKTNNGKKRIVKSKKNQNTSRGGKLQVLGNIRSRHHQISSDERKKVRKKYLGQSRKLLETKICNRNFITGISILKVPLGRYSRELRQIDQRTRKLMTFQKALYLRKEKEDSLASKAAWMHQEDYIKKNEERLIPAVKNICDNIKTSLSIRTITKKKKWEEKQLYGDFKWQTGEIYYKKTWTLLRKRKTYF